MKDEYRISFIIPVYNAEDFLKQSVDSILSQPYKDFEILLVDDGSVDTSGCICDEYAEKNDCVRVFHKQNGGVSSARNVGLDNASGEWIAFVDADDYLFEKTLTYNLFSNNEAMACDIIEFPFDRENTIYAIFNSMLKGTDFDKYYSLYFHNELWARFYKRAKIGDIRFDESLTIGEDVLFICKVLANCHSLYFNNEGGYFYNVNDTSVMRNADDCKIDEQRYALLNAFISNEMIDDMRVIEFYFRLYDILKGVNEDFRIHLRKNNIISFHRLFKTHFTFKRKMKYMLSML